MRLFQLPLLVVILLSLGQPAALHAQSVPADAATSGQKVKSPTYQGTISAVGADRSSFSITDKNGAPVTIRITAATTYQLDKNNSTFDGAVRVGLTVKGDLAPDGSAVMVTSKSPKLSAIDLIRQLMGATDDEWTVLRPLIENIQNLQNQLASATVSPKSLTTTTVAPDQINAELAARRAAQAKLSEELAKNRAELTKLVTLRQELVLLQLGIIE